MRLASAGLCLSRIQPCGSGRHCSENFAQLDGLAVTVFAKTPANPDGRGGDRGCRVLSKRKLRWRDCILGGGSPIDSRESALRLRLRILSRSETYAAIRNGIGKITASVAPVIAIRDHVGNWK